MNANFVRCTVKRQQEPNLTAGENIFPRRKIVINLVIIRIVFLV
jgi:hypothetical protein